MTATTPSAKQPCPCGSGKPFRKCCGKTASPAQRALGRHAVTPRLVALPDGRTVSPEQALQDGITLHRAGRFRRAADIYRAILSVKPDHADSLNLLGACERQLGRPDEAVRLIRRALDIQPDTAPFYNNLSDAYRMLENAPEAEAAARRAIALRPDLPEAHYNLGAALHLQRQTDAAISAYRSALSLRPGYLEARLGIGDALLVEGHHDDALDIYRQALQSAPDSPGANTRIGMALRRAKRIDEAIVHYTACIARQPRAEYYNNLALLYLQTDRKPDAAANLRKLLELTPGNTSARHLLDALDGKTTERAPAEYVRELFDQYAETFESHLVNKLDYRMPQLLGDVLHGHIGAARDLALLDLGCGTGLMGEVLRDICIRLVGVDISPKMVEKTLEKDLYTEAHADDLLTFMQRCAAADFDLVTAADVFVYLGDLGAIFREAGRLLRPGGWFAFTVEATAADEQGDFVLDATGRYRHNAGYLQRLAAASGLSQAHFSDAVIRTQNERPVNGYLCVYAKPGG